MDQLSIRSFTEFGNVAKSGKTDQIFQIAACLPKIGKLTKTEQVCSDSATLPIANKVNRDHANDFDVPSCNDLVLNLSLQKPDCSATSYVGPLAT